MVSGMTNATGTLRATVAGEVRAMMARRRITQTDLAKLRAGDVLRMLTPGGGGWGEPGGPVVVTGDPYDP